MSGGSDRINLSKTFRKCSDRLNSLQDYLNLSISKSEEESLESKALQNSRLTPEGLQSQAHCLPHS